jgi:hypothetical protein
VDASRVAVIGTGLSANAAAQTAVDRPEVEALVVLSGIIQKEEVFQILRRPELPVLLVAAANDERSSFVMQRYRGRFLSDVQQYIEFEPIDENDPCDWEGTDGLTPETGLGDLIVWFLQQNFPPERS